MSTSNTVTKTDLENIINAIFPATTEDMTQLQLDAFIASLNCQGANAPTRFGTSTDISSYTTKEGAFVAPTDGLVWIQCRYTSGNYIGVTLCNADGTNERTLQIVSYGSGNNMNCIPILKGMKVWVSSNNGSNNYADYIPYE